ncbi:precorrin-6y C5,15-methyltransferase (decarboxylating) subunit CbiE [Thiovibrio sp. JS02]
MSKLIVVGVGPGGFTSKQRQALTECRCIVASERFRVLAAELVMEVVPISPLPAALAEIEQRIQEGPVGVLASGDPFFFGIGRRLSQEFGPECLMVYPALTAMQLACARFRIPWDDADFVSLHGRDCPGSAARLLIHPKVGVFTDRQNSPDRIAAALYEYLNEVGAAQVLAETRIHVAENLGQADERLTSGSLAEIAARRFAPLNVLLIVRPARAETEKSPLGLTEAEIAHSRGLITKDEVRAVTLHRLRLPAEGVFWDLGAGSGSLSIEAARLCPALAIYAVEREAGELANVKKNIVDCQAFSILPVAGEAPDVVKGLPDPDRVFVGGSGGRLSEIVAEAVPRLRPHGRIVINGVTEKTRELAPRLLAENGLTVTISEVRVSRFAYPQAEAQEFNPIAIVVGKK